MKNIYLTLGSILIISSFTACGGSSSSSANDTNNSNNENTTSNITQTEALSEKIEIDVNCTEGKDIATYITLFKGDKIEEIFSNSKIKLYHDENNQKKVCLLSGGATISRLIESVDSKAWVLH